LTDVRLAGARSNLDRQKSILVDLIGVASTVM
jgi:hypothetical protein